MSGTRRVFAISTIGNQLSGGFNKKTRIENQNQCFRTLRKFLFRGFHDNPEEREGISFDSIYFIDPENGHSPKLYI